MKTSGLILFILLLACGAPENKNTFKVEQASAPLFRDPLFDGAADPTIVFNDKKKEWVIYYTQRRATLNLTGTEYCYGTAIGIATSTDQGVTWNYSGTLKLPTPFKSENTFWAPQVFKDPKGQTYHLLVSYIHGIYSNWGGTRLIFHYQSSDLENWTQLNSTGLEGCIDASVFQLPDQRWKMWFKDENNGSFTYAALSQDLIHWRRTNRPEVNNRRHEAPVVFRFQNKYWMITDPTYESYTGLDVFESTDAEHWTLNNTILNTPGKRPDDNDQGRHADVQVINGRAYIFYFTHPGRIYLPDGNEDPDNNRYRYRRSSLQVAELEIIDGKIFCNRDKFSLKP
jgi:beta-xylosidase